MEVIQLLIEAYPDAMKVEDGDGVLPIDRPQIKEKIYDRAVMVETEVENPDALKEKNELGELPLHSAVKNRKSVEEMQLLIKDYPDALKEKDNDGLLPLHYAAIKGASVEVMQLLIRAEARGVGEECRSGWPPHH